MSWYTDTVQAQGGRGSMGSGLISGQFVGNTSRKTVYWAILTLITAISGGFSHEISTDTAVVMGFNAISYLFLWFRLRKTQEMIMPTAPSPYIPPNPYIPSAPYPIGSNGLQPPMDRQQAMQLMQTLQVWLADPRRNNE